MPLARCFNLVHSELFTELVSHYLQKMLSPESSYHSKADLPAQKWVSTAWPNAAGYYKGSDWPSVCRYFPNHITTQTAAPEAKTCCSKCSISTEQN